jgi:hypothetical protein
MAGSRTTHKDLPVLTFTTVAAFEKQMSGEPRASKGFWLKLSKAGATKATIGKDDAIEAALCCGWIDGQLDRFDGHYFLVRMTPRRPGSRWSAKNRKTAERLVKQGRIRPAGLIQIEAAKNDGMGRGIPFAEQGGDAGGLGGGSCFGQSREELLRDTGPSQSLRHHLQGERCQTTGNPCAAHRRFCEHAGWRKNTPPSSRFIKEEMRRLPRPASAMPRDMAGMAVRQRQEKSGR